MVHVFSFDFHLRNVCCLEQGRVICKFCGSRAAAKQRWLFSWSGLSYLNFSCKYQAASLECSWSLFGGWQDTLCCVLCLQPHQTIPNIIQIHSPKSAVLPGELLKFWCLQQDLVSYNALVWWLEPGYSLGLKLGRVSRGRRRVSCSWGHRAPDWWTEQRRACSKQVIIDLPEARSTGYPWTRLGSSIPVRRRECFTPALCLVLFVYKSRRRGRGTWVLCSLRSIRVGSNVSVYSCRQSLAFSREKSFSPMSSAGARNSNDCATLSPFLWVARKTSSAAAGGLDPTRLWFHYSLRCKQKILCPCYKGGDIYL